MIKHAIVQGHGEGDLGALGVQGKYERQWLDDLFAEMRYLVRIYGLDDVIILITDRNTFKRQEFAKNTAFFLNFGSTTDIHLNAFNGTASGAEIIIPEGMQADEIDVRLFEKFKDRFGWRRWIVSDWYQQTRQAKAFKIPSYRLLECCFCDNTKDMATYVAEIKATAKDIIESILGYQLEYPVATAKPVQEILYRVQVGAFSVEENAKRLAKTLEGQGYKTYMIWEKDQNLHKVQVGAFAVKENAIKLAKELANRGHEPYIITTGDTNSVYIPKAYRYTNEEMVERIKAGHYGNEPERSKILRERGYDPALLQKMVNDSYVHNATKDFIKLHANVTYWRVYPLNVPRTPDRAIGALNPSLYGGLEYEVLEYTESGNVAIIQTSMFGKVQIWIGPDTKALYSIVKK